MISLADKPNMLVRVPCALFVMILFLVFGWGAAGQCIAQEPTPVEVVDGRAVGCLAAERWLPADVLRSRARSVIQAYCEEDDCTRAAARAVANFLCSQAEHQEDIGTATALRAYYTRIGLAEQLLLSQEALGNIDTEEARQNSLQEAGMPASASATEFERLRIDVFDQQLQMESKDRQLRSVLRQLTGLDYDCSCVQQERLDVLPTAIACDALKQHALAMRQDLLAWRHLSGHVTEASVPVFAQMLATAVGGWGFPLPTITGLKQLLCPPDYSCVAANLRHELQMTEETHRRWICQAVDEKCCLLEVAYERMALASRKVANWESRLAQLERLEEMGDGDPLSKAEARKGLMEARIEEVQRRLDARIAEIDLAEAIGGISDRCCSGMPWFLTGF